MCGNEMDILSFECCCGLCLFLVNIPMEQWSFYLLLVEYYGYCCISSVIIERKEIIFCKN